MSAWQNPKVLICLFMISVSLLVCIISVSSDGWAYADGYLINSGVITSVSLTRGLFEFCVEDICDYTGTRVRGEKVAAASLIVSIMLLSAAMVVAVSGIYKSFYETFKYVGAMSIIASAFLIIGCGTYTGTAHTVFSHTNNWESYHDFKYGWSFAFAWASSVLCFISGIASFITARVANTLNVASLTDAEA